MATAAEDNAVNPAEAALNDAVARTIKMWMGWRRMSQTDLAATTGLSGPSISLMLNGQRNISLANLVAMANAVNVAPNEILAHALENMEEVPNE